MPAGNEGSGPLQRFARWWLGRLDDVKVHRRRARIIGAMLICILVVETVLFAFLLQHPDRTVVHDYPDTDPARYEFVAEERHLSIDVYDSSYSMGSFEYSLTRSVDGEVIADEPLSREGGSSHWYARPILPGNGTYVLEVVPEWSGPGLPDYRVNVVATAMGGDDYLLVFVFGIVASIFILLTWYYLLYWHRRFSLYLVPIALNIACSILIGGIVNIGSGFT